MLDQAAIKRPPLPPPLCLVNARVQRTERLQECLFNKPGRTQKTYPFGKLCGAKPRPEAGPTFTINDIPPSKWRWEMAFRDALLSWLQELQWVPGMGPSNWPWTLRHTRAERCLPLRGQNCSRLFSPCMRERGCYPRDPGHWGAAQRLRAVPQGLTPARAARGLGSTLATMPSGHGRSSTSST